MTYSLDDDGNVGYNKHYSLVLLIPGVVAAISSSSILLTYALFRDLRKLKFVEIVFYIALNDFIASVSLAQGVVKNGSAACYFQGLATNINYLSSVLWACVITLQLHNAVTKKSIIKDLFWFHIVCWGLPLLVGLLVFTTNSYGNSIYTWCFIENKPTSPSYGATLWVYLSFYGWVYLALLFMIIVIGDMVLHLRRSANWSGAVKSAVQKLMWYPVMYLAVWLPSLVCDIAIAEKKDDVMLDLFGSILPVLQGFFMPLFFFSNNPAVRNRWYLLYRKLVGKRGFAAGSDGSKRSSVSAQPENSNSSFSSRSIIERISEGWLSSNDLDDHIIPIDEEEDFCDDQNREERSSKSTVGTVLHHKYHSSRWLFGPRSQSRRSDVSELSMASAPRPSQGGGRSSVSSDLSAVDTHNPMGVAEAKRELESSEWREGGDNVVSAAV